MLPKEDDDEEDAALVDEEIEKPDDDVPQQRASLINPQSSSAEQAKKLLERFVDLEQPVITEKMSQFMMEPGAFGLQLFYLLQRSKVARQIAA
jgi:hypothetical protein